MQNDYHNDNQNRNQDQDPEEHHRNMVNRVANNEGLNLNRQGNEGRALCRDGPHYLAAA